MINRNAIAKYQAVAVVTDGYRDWPVTIYSSYESIDDAAEGAYRFCRNYSAPDSPVAVKRISIGEAGAKKRSWEK